MYYKVGFIRGSTMRKYLGILKGSRRKLKTYDRRSLVSSVLIDKPVEVHNGGVYLKVNVTEKHVGLPIGDFVMTRQIARHKGKRKKKKLKKS